MDRPEQHGQAEEQRSERQAGDRHMHGEDEPYGLAQIVVDPSPEPHSLDDRTEVVVEQDDRGGFARDVRAPAAHCDADVGGLQRRGVVDAVAGHGDDRRLRPSAR